VPPAKVWEVFTQVSDLEYKPVRNGTWETFQKESGVLNGGPAGFDAWTGKLAVALSPGEARVLCIDRD